MRKAQRIYIDGKGENKLATKDSQDAQGALSNAIAVLETHYKKSGIHQPNSIPIINLLPHRGPSIRLLFLFAKGAFKYNIMLGLLIRAGPSKEA